MSISESELNMHEKASDYCKKAGGILGILYIISYMLKTLVLAHPTLALPYLAIALSTPFALAIASKHIGREIFTEEFPAVFCWGFGVKMVFYASLIEAAYIVIFNKWIDPFFLYEMKQALLAQFDTYLAVASSAVANGVDNPLAGFEQMILTEKSAIETMEVQSPIQAAFSAMTGNLLMGGLWMLLFAAIYKKSK